MSVNKNYSQRLALFVFLTLASLSSFIVASAQVLQGQAYDQHVELHWDEHYKKGHSYQILVSVAGGEWQLRQTIQAPAVIDFVNDLGSNLALRYKLVELKNNQKVELDTINLKTYTFSDDELLEMVQRYTFRYFWDNADPVTGWAKERQPDDENNIITSGGTGFGILSIITGVKRGWITREQALARLLKLTRSLRELESFHGMWSHWYKDGEVFHFSKYDDGGDLVESAFMAQGLLVARQYFNRNDKTENQLRSEITNLWEAMEWDWYTRYETGQAEKILTWHWSKNYGWKMDHRIKGYNEALIVYVLAAASPTHGIESDVYHQGWAWNNQEHFFFNNGKQFYGMTLPLGNPDELGGPLFFAHYSFLGLNPTGLSDKYADYWQQNQNHSLINRAYALDNPKNWKGYGAGFWGITAGDMVPKGYLAHSPGRNDKGTIAPTAALSSMPYTPKESMDVLKNLYYVHGKEAFGMLGFYDGINLSVSDDPAKQVVKTYLAIDQGPIVAMIENYRSGLLWEYFMRDPDVKRGLNKLGFTINGKPVQ